MTNTVGYNYWGYLSDKINISSPDGVATFGSWIFQEFLKRGYEIYGPPIDRDKESVAKYGIEAFAAFSQQKRWNVYNKINWLDLDNLPMLDIYISEVRFETKDNIKSPTEDGYSPDLDIYHKLLNHYSQQSNTKVILLDLDYKILDEDRPKATKILEQGINPKIGNETFYIPFDFEEMTQFITPIPNRTKLLAYVGNNYNREIDIKTKIIPFARNNSSKVHFYGNWMKDELKEFREQNKKILFHDRIGFNEFRNAIGDSCAVPLLAPEDYKKNGVMTMRILETLLFGSIPIGFDDFVGIKNWLPKELIVKMKDYDSSMSEVVDYLSRMPWTQRNVLRLDLINKLKEKHDVSHFVDLVLK
jgi:hypothetical protein